MKYMTALTLCVAIIILAASTVFDVDKVSASAGDFVRIHIRANSNELSDQLVKYDVKNAVVKAMIPILSECTSKPQALQALKANLNLIEVVATDVLMQKGFSYTARARLKEEYFPTRSYDQYVLGSGIYDALILELGSAGGNNWWCVVYPPLCFVNVKDTPSDTIKYQSKLLEIIKKFFNK